MTLKSNHGSEPKAGRGEAARAQRKAELRRRAAQRQARRVHKAHQFSQAEQRNRAEIGDVLRKIDQGPGDIFARRSAGFDAALRRRLQRQDAARLVGRHIGRSYRPLGREVRVSSVG